MGRSASDNWLQILIFNFDDDDADIRMAAATAAGALLHDAAVTPLGMLLDDSETDVQIAALQALGEIGGEEAERILTRCQRESVIPEVREAAEDALAAAKLLDVPIRDDRGADPDFSDSDGEIDGPDF
jgi:HEAT repeat protein